MSSNYDSYNYIPYNTIELLKDNLLVLSQIQNFNYSYMQDEILKYKKESESLKITLNKKRKIEEETCCENTNIKKSKKLINKYELVNYNKNKNSFSDDTIENIFSKLRCIKDIIEIKNLWREIRHNSKLQRLYYLVPALEKLDEMVGLESVKKDIFKVIIYYIQNQHTDEYLHTIIEGPPGVGKTEFAKIYADIFVRLGILKTDKFIEIKKDDLVAKYLGQTSHRTKELLESGMGGVIFLDEAYSLGNEEKRDSFAKEAIDMINQYLSEKKKDFMFIIAGYSDDLEKCFFAFNKGLKRRFSQKFSIEKYNDSELEQIFRFKSKLSGYTIDEKVDTINFFKIHSKKFEYYAGDIEKLLNYIKYDQSLRCFKSNINNKIITNDDLKESISKFKEAKKYEIPMGLYT